MGRALAPCEGGRRSACSADIGTGCKFPVTPRRSVRQGGGGERHMASGPGNDKKRATIWEVARVAGVSHQTVSRYLRNEGGLRPATREKIDKAVAALDYRPNLIARSMRTRRSNRIAIVLPDLTNFVPIHVLKGASQAAREAGYSTDVVGLEGDAVRRAEEALALLDSRQVDGLLSLTPLSDTVITAGDRRPIVVYGEYDDNMHSQGHLADGRRPPTSCATWRSLGHRRFLHVAGSEDWASALNRRGRLRGDDRGARTGVLRGRGGRLVGRLRLRDGAGPARGLRGDGGAGRQRLRGDGGHPRFPGPRPARPRGRERLRLGRRAVHPVLPADNVHGPARSRHDGPSGDGLAARPDQG